jgi:diguanylate cyclase (GGDEF)-like protein
VRVSDQTKAFLRIAVVLAIGLAPALAALVLTPSRGTAFAAAGNAAMAVVFVSWMQRLVAEGHHLKTRGSVLQGDLTSLQEKVQAQTRELREANMRDAASGALNRSAFLQRFDEAIARDARIGKPLAFLLVDIEGFKSVNIERGRIGGDQTLKRVAHALQDATRGTDFIGRLGGDEFGVVLNDCEDPGPAVNRIFLNLQNGEEGAKVVHVAVGAVTIESPAAGVDLQELFRVAEGALASVRGTGGSLCARRTLQGATERRATTDRHAATA